jgi:hypothetical protein
MPKDAPAMQLYRVAGDPEEQRNAVADHPDVVRELLGLLNRYRQQPRSVDLA